MTTTLDTPPAETAGAADTPTQAALNESAIDAALREELGLEPDQALLPEVPSPQSVSNDAEDPNTAEVPEATDAVAADPEAEADPEAPDPADPKAEADPEAPDPADADAADLDSPALDAIPEELQPKVGALLKEMRERTRAKVTEKLTQAQTLADELTGKVPQLEQERDELRGSLDELRAAKAVPAPTASNPLASITDLTSLEAAEDALWQAKRQLQTAPGEVQVDDGQGGKRYLDESEAAARLAFIDERLQRHLPRQRTLLQEQASARTAVISDFPDLSRKGSELHRATARVIAANPQIKAARDYHRTALAQAIGEQMLATHGKQAWAEATGKAAKPRAAAQPPAQPAAKPPPPVRARSAPQRASAKVPAGEFDQAAYERSILGQFE